MAGWTEVEVEVPYITFEERGMHHVQTPTRVMLNSWGAKAATPGQALENFRAGLRNWIQEVGKNSPAQVQVLIDAIQKNREKHPDAATVTVNARFYQGVKIKKKYGDWFWIRVAFMAGAGGYLIWQVAQIIPIGGAPY